MRKFQLLVSGLCLFAFAGCTGEPTSQPNAYLDNPEAADFALDDGGKADSVAARLALIMTDTMFLDAEHLIDAPLIQGALDESVYGSRSWLADEMIGDETFAEVLVRVAQDQKISPLVILARLQIEQSLVSRIERPSDHTVDRALGCGCHDGQSCYSRFLGLENQILCSAETFRELYDASVDGSGQWQEGKRRKTLDNYYITPASHATAALYAYTPWALPGRGGNWLTRQITLKIAGHLDIVEGFTGAACEDSLGCQFDHGDEATFCLHDAFWVPGPSICSASCHGFCDDQAGYAPTFCAALNDKDLGVCLPRAHSINRQCADGDLVSVSADRYIGTSDAADATATVCAPEWLVSALIKSPTAE